MLRSNEGRKGFDQVQATNLTHFQEINLNIETCLRIRKPWLPSALASIGKTWNPARWSVPSVWLSDHPGPKGPS